MKYEGDDNEWLIIGTVKIPAVVPLSFSADRERLYALPGGLQRSDMWICKNRDMILKVFKTHRPKVCEYHR